MSSQFQTHQLLWCADKMQGKSNPKRHAAINKTKSAHFHLYTFPDIHKCIYMYKYRFCGKKTLAQFHMYTGPTRIRERFVIRISGERSLKIIILFP
jgi:hypothetical protein